jgi:predicted glutamine amidotransferase
MCRLYAVLARSPVPVAPAFRGLRELAREHKDGWGVVHFDAGAPELEHDLASAAACPRFAELTERTHSRALMAHIRLASVGQVRLENAHPFTDGRYAFAHNGTLKPFAGANQALLESKLRPEIRAALQGETDSERCFGLFRSLLEGEEQSTHALAQTMARVMRTVGSIFGDKDTCSANFVVSDGKRLVATRRGRTLFTHHGPTSVAIASERLWPSEAWVEVPEEGVVTVDAELDVQRYLVSEL